MLNRERSAFLDSLIILLSLCGLYFIYLGTRPLFVPDEGRYAEIAREMVSRGDLITPYLNGIKYFEKPVLFYWLTAAAIKVFGVNLWSVRAVNAILSILTCLATYFCVRCLYNRTAGFYAALILGTSFLFTAMGRMVTLDLPVTCFISLSLYAFLYSINHPSTRKRWMWCAFALSALAVLTKGLIGIVFPVLIVGLWVLFQNQWHALKKWHLFSSAIVFFLIAVPWHLAVQWQNPEFAHFYFIDQHILRYLSKEIGHYQPVWFFIPCIALGFFPWTFFLPQTINDLFRNQSHRGPASIFFLIWACTVFLFFSLSKSKLIPYVLPIFPPLSILTAIYLSQHKKLAPQGVKIGYFCTMLAAIVISIVLNLYSRHAALPHPIAAQFYSQWGTILLISGSIAAFFCCFRNPNFSFYIISLASAAFTLMIFAAMTYVDTRTIRPIAQVLNHTLQPRDEVITYDRYYQDLPFYLQKTVSILNWQNELTFGYHHQNEVNWMINFPQFWERWRSGKKVYVLMTQEDYENISKKYPEDNFIIITQFNGNILAANM